MAEFAHGESAKAAVLSSKTFRLASLVLVVTTIVALGAVAYFTERGIVASRDLVIHTYQVRTELKDLQLELMRSWADQTAYFLLHRRNELSNSENNEEKSRQTIAVLRNLTQDNPRQQARLEEISPLQGQIASLMKTHRNATAGSLELLSGAILQDKIADSEKRVNLIIRAMQDEEDGLLAQRLTAWNYLFRRNVIMLTMAFCVVAVMLAYNCWLLIKEVSQAREREKREQANADSYRLMSARILELQDTERRRIARELHDSVGQFLAGLKINLSQLESGNRPDAQSLLHETIELTDCTLQEVRTISHLLHPPLLEELGFLSAAQWYVDEYGKRSQVKVSLVIDEPIKRLPREIEIALFRVLQETLTNVYRHAAARTVDIRISCRNGSVCLTVADDGKGIPLEVLSRFYEGAAAGIGLAGMRERLAEFGGEMHVHSSSAGAVIEAKIPTPTLNQSSRSGAAA